MSESVDREGVTAISRMLRTVLDSGCAGEDELWTAIGLCEMAISLMSEAERLEIKQAILDAQR